MRLQVLVVCVFASYCAADVRAAAARAGALFCALLRAAFWLAQMSLTGRAELASRVLYTLIECLEVLYGLRSVRTVRGR